VTEAVGVHRTNWAGDTPHEERGRSNNVWNSRAWKMTWLTQQVSGTKKIARTRRRQTQERKTESTMAHPETKSSRLRSSTSQQKNEQHTREIQNQIFPLRENTQESYNHGGHRPPSLILLKWNMCSWHTSNLETMKMKLGSG
jgi:hypothetical protein